MDVIISKTSQQELDDIETQQNGEPHRFSDYRHARCKKTAPAVGITCEDVYDTITQEEVRLGIEGQLRYRQRIDINTRKNTGIHTLRVGMCESHIMDMMAKDAIVANVFQNAGFTLKLGE